MLSSGSAGDEKSALDDEDVMVGEGRWRFMVGGSAEQEATISCSVWLRVL